jgi:signal transduction histidine kinase/CheY-like chemotaxis protein
MLIFHIAKQMETISTIEEVENFIYNFSLYQSKAENQALLFEKLKICEQIAFENSNNKLLCNTRIFITNYYVQINDLENALHTGLDNKKLSESECYEQEKTTCYSILINLYHLLGDYASAEELIQKMHEILIDSKNYERLCGLNIIMAIQYYNLKDFDNCVKSNELALVYAKKSENINLLIYVYSNYGFQLLNYNISLSEAALRNALNIIKINKTKLPKYSIAIVELNASRLFMKLNDYKLSNKLITSAIKKLTQISNINELNYAKLVLGELLIEKSKFKSALALLQDIEKTSLEHKNKSDLQSCYQNYIILYEKMRKYKNALEYYKHLQKLNEDIFNEESNRKIRNLQILNEVNDIKRQRDHAETMANLKHDFLANMSHEIRTPINSVLGICYLLQQDKLNDKQTSYIQRLQRSGENLLGLINDILDISKIEAGKMELVPAVFSLPDVMKEVYNLLLYKADEKKIKFNLNIAPELSIHLKGDANRLSQVLLNLISNALKFTEIGSVNINVSLSKIHDSIYWIQFEIIDTGIGISKDKINTIFERYEQAAASITTKFGGTGLGLSISRKIIELMNGTISISSKEKNGSTFTVNIPFEIDSKKIKNSRKKINPVFLNAKSILIADDHEENRLIMKDILLSFNNSVTITEATNGSEVLQLLDDNNFNLLLIDLEMPVKNGFETIFEIRKNKKYDNLKVIANTASILTMTKEEIIAVGFDDIILKPFKAQDLLSKLQLFLK